MAFNFNWSPLTADEDFYRRARDLLTTALNKSPKPPIIVDDILVTEFNLGSVPPDLEILEIGDLAEDRFRGIFKMCYSGDAFLTLKTRVQANPLNTYLYSKPSFTSPQPLAAASGLTIPLSITLSEIKLSAFIILVFSKQKGLTLVFRNDPLESLKVSSTFDSIQFVRDYLQRTIENQLRTLMMDELPAIIHRLSLQLWCPDQIIRAEDDKNDDLVEDPLSSSPMDLVEGRSSLDAVGVSSLSLDDGADMQSIFSLRNLLRLKSLKDSPTSLDLLAPSVKDFVCRIWSGPFEGSSSHNSPPTATPSLTKSNSFHGTATTYTFSDSGSSAHGHLPSRPSLVSLHSATTGLSLGSGARTRSYQGRKKKTRVVNLRKSRSDYSGSEASGPSSAAGSETASVRGAVSEPLIEESIPEEPEDEAVVAPAVASPSKVRFERAAERPRPVLSRPPLLADLHTSPEVPASASPATGGEEYKEKQVAAAPPREAVATGGEKATVAKAPARPDTSSVILEQAWIMKMAGEIARRVYEEKNRRQGGFWEEREETPPPAYTPSR